MLADGMSNDFLLWKKKNIGWYNEIFVSFMEFFFLFIALYGVASSFIFQVMKTAILLGLTSIDSKSNIFFVCVCSDISIRFFSRAAFRFCSALILYFSFSSFSFTSSINCSVTYFVLCKKK